MLLEHIELGKLKISPLNMRHGKQAPDVSDILPSIRARGILVPLLVRPNGDGKSFEIVAGRRRFFSAKAVAAEKKGEAAEIEPLPCAVMEPGDDAAALEASLIENTARLDPDDMTQFETFTRLVKEGRGVADIADTFGITELMVKRRLALGNLLPKIKEAYRQDDINADTIRHLTLASKAQQKEWFKLFADEHEHAPRGSRLKQWLFGGVEITTDVALFPLEDYKGQIISDLFGEQSYFADGEQFWTMQNEAIAAKRDAYLEAGWSDVSIFDAGEYFPSWEYQKTPRQEGGKVYISVSHRGGIEVHEGYLTIKEARQKRIAKEKGVEVDEIKTARPELTKAAQNYMELHRHAAVRHTLLSRPGVALRLMVDHAIGGSSLWRVDADPQRAAKEAIAESIAKAPAEIAFAEESKAVLKLVGSPVKVRGVVGCHGLGHGALAAFTKLLKLSDEEITRVLAFVMAETLEAGAAPVEAVGIHLGVDMAEHWQPDETFFELIRDKKVVNAILKEVGGKRIADGNITATGKVQKKIIGDFLEGREGRKKVDGWLPGYFRFPFKPYTSSSGLQLVDNATKAKKLFR